MNQMKQTGRSGKICGVVWMVLALSAANLAWAQGAGGRAPNEFYPKVPKNIDAGGAKPAPAPANPVAQAAAQRGSVRCGERISQFTNFLSSGGQSSAHLFVSPANADQKLVSVSMSDRLSHCSTSAGRMTATPAM